MLINVKEFLNDAHIKEALYPGKRIVKPCKQIGEYKNHCVVVDWRDPETITIAIKPGLNGKQLAPEMAKKYPVCFQMPTQIKIKVINDNNEDDEEDEGTSKGKSSGGGGGRKPAKKKKNLKDIASIAARFGDGAEGKTPSTGTIKEMIIMGVEIAKDAFDIAFTELTKQIRHAKISATEMLAKAANMVTRVQPPEFMTPKGDETADYNYDREKNADIGFKVSLG